jgi:hypothetical protein
VFLVQNRVSIVLLEGIIHSLGRFDFVSQVIVSILFQNKGETDISIQVNSNKPSQPVLVDKERKIQHTIWQGQTEETEARRRISHH